MTMEYTAQGMGTNADGDDVMLDITRFAAGDDAVIVGDSVSVTIGDPFSAGATTLERIPMLGLGDPDVVARDGDNVSGSDVELIHDDTGETVAISFQLACCRQSSPAQPQLTARTDPPRRPTQETA